MVISDPPLCRPVNRLLFGLVLVLCSLVMVLIVWREQHKLSLKPTQAELNKAAMINGASSVWIPVPAILGILTPEHLLKGLGPRQRCLRQLTCWLSFLAMCTSLAFWNIHLAVLLIADEICALTLFFLFLVLAIWRGGWVGWCAGCFAIGTLVVIIADQTELQVRYMPWPHCLFRLLAGACFHAAVNGGCLLSTPSQAFQTGFLLIFMGLVHTAIEFHSISCDENEPCYHVLMLGHYFWASVRCSVTGLLYVLVVIFVFGWKQLTACTDEQQNADDDPGKESSYPKNVHYALVGA